MHGGFFQKRIPDRSFYYALYLGCSLKVTPPGHVMAILVISISLDSSEDSGSGTLLDECSLIPTETPIIAPTIPPSLDYTPASPDYSPASDSESDPSEDPSSDHIPPLPAISPFLSSDDDTTDSDTPDTPHYLPYDSLFLMVDRTATILMAGTHDDCEEEGWTVPISMYFAVRHLPIISLDSSYFTRFIAYFCGAILTRRLGLPMTSVPAFIHCSELYLLSVLIRIPSLRQRLDECIAYADALRDRGIDVRVVVEAIGRDETETGVRGPVEVRVERVTHSAMPKDIPDPAQEGAAIEGVQREQGHKVVGVESKYALTERIAEKMPNTRSGASMTREEFEEWLPRMDECVSISVIVLNVIKWKYATCTLQDSALTWWNSHKRTIGVEAAYAMNWVELMKLMTEVYCPRNEIQKMETELWN
ncbi:reverse transcriptase domain-containing protein [Tanacetum coccineum]